MLAKKNRLNLSLTENQEIFSSTKRLLTENLIIHYQKNKSFLRVAAIAPVRLYAKAAQRNYHRRLLYNLIIKIDQEERAQNKKNIFEKKIDLIIVYRKKCSNLEKLKKELDFGLNKLFNNETI
jgi:RNase P protein component